MSKAEHAHKLTAACHHLNVTDCMLPAAAAAAAAKASKQQCI